MAEAGDGPDTSWRREGLWALEILTLTSIVVARPVLSMVGGAPMVFRTREATPLLTTAWLVLLVAVPLLVVTGLGLASRGLGALVRRRVPQMRDLRWPTHVVLVALLAGLVGWRFMVERPDMDTSSVVAVLVGTVAAGGVGYLRWWPGTREVAATFLRWAAVASLVFVGQFVFSDAGREVYSSSRVVDTAAAARVADEVGEEAPPVVVVVMDELPTATLMDDEGAIDAELFPNLAGLADRSTWYRNHTTNALTTWVALPSLITGTYLPLDNDARELGPNLFTMLGESHDLSINEQVTDMCGPPYCAPAPPATVLGGLVSDSRWVWEEAAVPAALFVGLLPGLEGPRYGEDEAWIDQLDLEGGDRPPFVFHHMLLPHAPWELLPDGRPYERVPASGHFMNTWSGGSGHVDASRQRHLLQVQAADRLVGRMLDRLEDAGRFDEAVVVVTADHGHGFIPDEGRRSASEGSLHETLWSPLLVKLPGQEEGRVADHNVQLVDILPTIAEAVGTEVPWEIDGRSADPVEPQRGSEVTFTHEPTVEFEETVAFEETGGGMVRLDGERYFARLLDGGRFWPGTGPEAAWQRTGHHGLLRRAVSDLPVGDPVEADVDLMAPSRWRPGAEVPPVVVQVGTGLEAGTVVAFAVDGAVAGVTEVVPDDPSLAEGLLLPEFLHEGAELEMFVVEGEVGDETLRPLPSPT